jgi:hypothetical protein
MTCQASDTQNASFVARGKTAVAWRRGAVAVRRVALVLAVSFLAAISAAAQKPGAHIDTAITSDSRETMTERTVFPPTQRRVYVFYMMVDAAKGQKVKALWIAERADGMPPNKSFSEVETSSAGGTYWGSFSYPKPKDGPWPIGAYRVEIQVDGTLAANTKFEIQN